MACFRPIPAYRTSGGEVVFSELARYDIVESMQLRCEHCDGCKADYSSMWASRAMHEKKMHRESMFVTLTFNADNLPYRGQLEYSTFQKWMRRMRKEFKEKLRFFMCGEYGDLNGRPHFHAIVYGLWPEDAEPWRKNDVGDQLYRSPLLEKLWPYGHVEFGQVTYESCRYVAGYVAKKFYGDEGKYKYKRFDELGEYDLVPPFTHMSLKPGIGAQWLDKFWSDVFPAGELVEAGGLKRKLPRYYEKRLKRRDPDAYEALKMRRAEEGRARADDNTPARLAVREECLRAKVSRQRRDL